jgi:Pyruvate/2-oxoacid:ferredoxin oxidoreductase delta subunit
MRFSIGKILDNLLAKVPLIGKIITSIVGLLELPILEFFRRIDKRYNINSLGIVDEYLLHGRRGGKVVPLNRNIPVSTKFSPTEEILEIIKRSNITGVSHCYCRTIQREFNEPNCDHPLNTCIHVGFGKSLEEIPYKSENLKKVDKGEIIKLLEDCDERGLIHQLIYFPNPNFYYVICNCCPCCCVVLKDFLQKGAPRVVASKFIAETNEKLCNNCGECIKWCYFGARIIENNRLNFNPKKCFGCGICVSKCSQNAIKLNKK